MTWERETLRHCSWCGRRVTLKESSWSGSDEHGDFLLCSDDLDKYHELRERRSVEERVSPGARSSAN